MKSKHSTLLICLLIFMFFTFPSCSDVGRTLVFQEEVSVSGYLEYRIAQMRTNGTDRITFPLKGQSPQWVPGTKTHFAYVEKNLTGSGWKLWVANRDGSNAVVVDDRIATDYSWSPDGEWLLVSKGYDGGGEICKIKKDGSQTVRLTNTSDMAESLPRWNPQNNRIVCHGHKPVFTDDQLYLIDADGPSTPQPLTPSNLDVQENGDTKICWSPDGTRVAFVAQEGIGLYNVYTIDVSTKTLRKITNKKSAYSRLAWEEDFLFYFDYATLYRFDTKSTDDNPAISLGTFGGEAPASLISVNASHVYLSYAKVSGFGKRHIYAIQHYTGDVTDLGSGSNPDVW